MTRVERSARMEAILTGSARHDRLGRRAVHGSAVSIVGQMVRTAIQISGIAILARLLVPGDFGLIAMAMTVTGFVGMFSDLGLSAATVQRSELTQRLVSTLLFLNILAGLSFMLVTWLLAPVAALVFGDGRVLAVTMVMGIAIPITAAGAQHAALLNRSMNWVRMQVATLSGHASGLAAAVIAILVFDAGYWGIVAQTLTAACVTSAIYWLSTGWRPDRVLDWRGAQRELGFGLHLTGFNFLNYFHRQLDNGLIGWRWGATELGFYSRGYSLFYIVQVVCSTPISNVLMPVLSRSRHNAGLWRMNVLDAGSGVALTNGLFGMLLVSLSSSLVGIVLGPGWSRSAEILLYLSPVVLISSQSVLGAVFIARGDSRGLLRSATISVALYVIGFVVALPFGAPAVAASYAINNLLSVSLTIYMAFKADAVRPREYLQATLPFQLVGVAIATVVHALVPGATDGLGIVGVITWGAGLALAYGALVACIIWFDPHFVRLKGRILSFASGHLPSRTGSK